MSRWDSIVEFSSLVGKTIIDIQMINNDELDFHTIDGEHYKLVHMQDCCECVDIDDICGDLEDLKNSPIVVAEEVSHSDFNPIGVKIPEYQDSFTWTFYKLDTIKGGVTIRWYGSSNGYYSERVSLLRMNDD